MWRGRTYGEIMYKSSKMLTVHKKRYWPNRPPYWRHQVSGIPSGFEKIKIAMRLLQLNLNHCEAAQDILMQTVGELNVDVALLSEPYKAKSENWMQDTSGKTAIWSCGRHPAYVERVVQENGFVCGRIEDIYIYSCYIPPSTPLSEFEVIIQKIAMDASTRQRFIIAGDFNAWAVEWGSQRTSPKGTVILEAFTCLEVALLNTGEEYTFYRNGFGSIIDITFVSSNLYLFSKWKLSECYTQSDHMAIVCDIHLKERRLHKVHSRQKFRGWQTGTLDVDVFNEMMRPAIYKGSANSMASELMFNLRAACDASMLPKTSPKQQNAYWWNEHLQKLRREGIKARRRFQRSRGRPLFLEHRALYKAARHALKVAIKESKRQRFLELCDEAENNPWGTAYKIVRKKLNVTKEAIPTCPVFLGTVVDTLFPRQRRLVSSISREQQSSFEKVTSDEVLEAAINLEDYKSPGPSGIPNLVLKLATNNWTSCFVNLFNKCLSEGTFPSIWKRQTLVLLPKPGRPPSEPSSYRPICLLDSAGKILERVLCNRLKIEVQDKGGISDNQFGFRKRRSTIHAVSTATQLALDAISGDRWLEGSKEYCLIVTLDIKNAFNTANWANILDTLDRIGISFYLRRLIRSYFQDRLLEYKTSAGIKNHFVTGGVPQGSVLGPLLWNIMYDGVLCLRIPKGTKIIAFADDIAVIGTAKHLSDICDKVNKTIEVVQNWLLQNGLQLAEQKTEAVLISSRKKLEEVTIRVGEHSVTTIPAIKYLGIMLDKRLSFKTHLEYANKKASATVAALSRIMLNVRGPKQRRRQLLASVVKNQILYGAPVWHNATHHASYIRCIKSTYRLCALRVCSAFKTVSDDAALVVAGMYPIDILAEEAAKIFESKIERLAARETSMQIWQQRWDSSTNGRWTYRCIPDLKFWLKRAHGEVDFYLTQFLTGHGCFKSYLYRFKHEPDAICDHCGGDEIEDVYHVFFKCTRFGSTRRTLRCIFGENCSPASLVQSMLQSSENWRLASDVIADTMKRLRTLERLRRSSGD